MMAKNILIIGLFLFISQLSFSQDTVTVTNEPIETSMITNRPGFTEASRAVFKKGFQIETGFQYSKTPFVKGSSDYYANLLVPNLGLIYGVSKNVELRVFTNWEGDKFVTTGNDGLYLFDVYSVIIGSKINLTKAHGAVPEMALLITEVIPTVETGVETWSTMALLAWSYGLPGNFGISGNLSYTVDYEFDEFSSIYNPHHLGYTVNLGYSITNQIGTYAELYGSNNLGNGDALDVNLAGGFMYRINPKFQVDLIGGYGFETGATLVNAGFSWLILKE